MKNLLLLFCLALCVNLSYGQIKVFQSGNTVAGDNTGLTDAFSTFSVVGNTGITIETPGSFANVLSGIDNSRRLTLASNTSSSQSSAFFTMWGDETHDGNNPNTNRAGELAVGCAYFQVRPAKPVPGFSAVRFEVSADGATRVFGDLFTNGTLVTSTKLAKKNVKAMTYGLDEVLKMNTASYFYNGVANTDDSREHFGVIAEEFQKIVPEAVVEYTHNDVDAGTNDKYLAVDEGMIKFILINAMQEQQELIEAQAAKIAELEKAFTTIGSTEVDNQSRVTLSAIDLAELGQNQPNPFNGSTTIDYVIPTDSKNASISIFGTSGQLMKTVAIQHLGKGTLAVDAADLPSGTYSYTLNVDGRTIKTSKMVVAR